MKRIYLLLACVFIMAMSCDPPRLCTEPKCSYSDVYVNIAPELSGNLDAYVNIAPELSGNLDAYVNVGDTIRFTLKIPDTLFTNYGELVFGQLYEGSFFGVGVFRADSFDENIGYGGETIPVFTQIGKSDYNSSVGAQYWNLPTRKYECFIVPDKAGLCSIEMNTGRVEMKAKDGREWLVMPGHNFENVDRHVDLYVSWFPESIQAEARQVGDVYVDRYYFEVR